MEKEQFFTEEQIQASYDIRLAFLQAQDWYPELEARAKKLIEMLKLEIDEKEYNIFLANFSYIVEYDLGVNTFSNNMYWIYICLFEDYLVNSLGVESGVIRTIAND